MVSGRRGIGLLEPDNASVRRCRDRTIAFIDAAHTVRATNCVECSAREWPGRQLLLRSVGAFGRAGAGVRLAATITAARHQRLLLVQVKRLSLEAFVELARASGVEDPVAVHGRCLVVR